MPDPNMRAVSLPGCTISFTSLITAYKGLQSKLMQQVAAISANNCTATPGTFLLIQFQMSNLSQIGQSISNMIAQVSSIISNAIRNQQSH